MSAKMWLRIDCADQALMEAMRSGRNHVVIGDTLAA
jgi:PleD family two-component response regulator